MRDSARELLLEKLRQYIEAHYSDSEPADGILTGGAHSFGVGATLGIPKGARSFSGAGVLSQNGIFSKLKEKLERQEFAFSECLLYMISERGLTDAAVYKRAQIDRRLFAKIRKDKHYQPKKQTVFAFVIALELNIDEAKELLASAGYAISRGSNFDLAMEFFIMQGIYDFICINECLEMLGLPLFGVE